MAALRYCGNLIGQRRSLFIQCLIPSTLKGKLHWKIVSCSGITFQNKRKTHNCTFTVAPLESNQATPLQFKQADRGSHDFNRTERANKVTEVILSHDAKTVKILWPDRASQSYPFVWLRDNCRCETCFHPSALQRVTDFKHLDSDIAPEKIALTESNCSLNVTWSDGHTSEYNMSWLKAYKFNQSDKDSIFEPNLRYWGADIGEKELRFFDFDHLMTSDKALYEWLLEIQELGLAVVKNAPRKTGQIQRIGDRVGFLRPCNYGSTFHVKTKIDASNAAYTSGYLPLHTDLAYYIWAPGIQLLHCIDQTTGTGGENILCDGFKVAEDLRREDPEAFNILTSAILEFYDVGTDYVGKYHQRARHPTIRIDNDGKVAAIYWSDHGRDPMLRLPITDVLPLYRAMKAYHDRLHIPSNLFKYKMHNGDIVCFNNRRSLHGREKFTVTETSSRYLEGAYLEWDEVNSKIRLLREELENDNRM